MKFKSYYLITIVPAEDLRPGDIVLERIEKEVPAIKNDFEMLKQELKK